MKISFARLVWHIGIVIVSAGFLFDSCLAQPQDHRPSSGRVFHDGSWRTPEALGQRSQNDERLQEYAAQRASSPDTFEGQVKLAHWCGERGLDERRDAHLKRALMHNPDNRRVRSLLEHISINGNWFAPEEIQKHKSEFAAAKQRFRDWRKPVKKIAGQLRSNSARKRDAGLRSLSQIDDPRAVTALEVILTPISETIALQTLSAIHRFPHREATESIARMALLDSSSHVRQRACDLLSIRNRFDFVPGLIRELVSPISTQFSIVPDANGNVLYQYLLFQKDMDKDVVPAV